VNIFNKLTKGVEWMLVGLLGMMVTLVFINVVLRYVFNYGIVFTEEVSRFMFMWITLIGAVVVMKDNGHLGMGMVVSRLGERGQRICRFIADLMTLGCCGLLVKGSWQHVLLGMEDMAPVTGIPLGLIQASLLISSFGIGMVLAYSLWRQVTGRMPREELIPFSE
jgi:TRAP-type C4-dicarboxylate transport system permease small subunit